MHRLIEEQKLQNPTFRGCFCHFLSLESSLFQFKAYEISENCKTGCRRCLATYYQISNENIKRKKLMALFPKKMTKCFQNFEKI